jgi:hypothetical protein
MDDPAAAHAPAADPTEDPDAQQQARPKHKQAVPPGAELKQRLDQVSTILAKGLDLAEAGVSLGVSIISRVGAAAQQKFREGMETAAAAGATAAGSGPAQQAEAVPPVAAEAAAREPEPTYGITNRLPLIPGGEVSISFSVNNDSMTEPKKVALRIEGFSGDAYGALLEVSTFAIEPAQKMIAPVDFEKFILRGKVPTEAPPDVYRGTVLVVSGNELKIPVVLVVVPL